METSPLQVVLAALIDALEQCQEAAVSDTDAAAAAALIKQHKETVEAQGREKIARCVL